MDQLNTLKNGKVDDLALGPKPEQAIACPVSVMNPGLEALSSSLCHTLEEAGCPLAGDLHHRFQFETLLTELSATFVNVPASQVDAQIEWGLPC